MAHLPEPVILTNMCMVTNEKGRFLTQNRVNKSWPGVAFPGGHVEQGESLTSAVIREIFEETGLKIETPQLCGIKHYWDNKNIHTMVLFYKTNRFSGEIRSSEEGEVKWMTLDELKKAPLAHGFDMMLKMFLEDNITEIYYSQNSTGEFEIR